MKLTNIRFLGRYTNTTTGKTVNIHKGRQVGRACDVLFYYSQFKRVYVSDAEFYGKTWETVS